MKLKRTAQIKTHDNSSAKVALVAGGSRGIGRAVALSLAKQGMTVCIAHLRNDRAAEDTANEIRSLGSGSSIFRLDVKNHDEICDMFKQVHTKYGRLDYFVHAVGLGVFKPLSELSAVQLTRTFDINARSFILCAQESKKIMTRGSAIVAISSLGGQRYVSDYGAVGVAKAAMEASVRYLAVEFAHKGIRVNGVSGGPVDTDGVKLMPNYEKRKMQAIQFTPAGRIASVEDVARIVTFLCSIDSDWIRGQILIADGGLSLKVPGL